MMLGRGTTVALVIIHCYSCKQRFVLINTRQLNKSHCEAVLCHLRVQIVFQIGGHLEHERLTSGNQIVVSI